MRTLCTRPIQFSSHSSIQCNCADGAVDAIVPNGLDQLCPFGQQQSKFNLCALCALALFNSALIHQFNVIVQMEQSMQLFPMDLISSALLGNSNQSSIYAHSVHSPYSIQLSFINSM